MAEWSSLFLFPQFAISCTSVIRNFKPLMRNVTMKNRLILAGMCIVTGITFAQSGYLNPMNSGVENAQSQPGLKSLEFWSSTFGTPSDWLIDHDTNACDLDWVIGTQACGGSFPIESIRSTTKSDGWAMIDSDLYGLTNGGSEVEDSWISMANPVDLTGYPNVIVEFETHYRRFNYEQPYLVVGFGDGSGASSVVWPDLNPDTDVSEMNNVFPLFTNFADNEISDNGQRVRVNISGALVGMGVTELQNVYIRLHWTGSWGYAWFVDDFRIFEQPLYDVQMSDAWIRGVSNDDIHYSVIPVAQLDTAWMIGGEVYNFGANELTNLSYNVSYPFFSTSDFSTLIFSDSTLSYESQFDGTLPTGLLTGTYTIEATEETSGPEFGNNALSRKVNVMNAGQQIYAQDGIGLNDPLQERTTVIGTTSLLVNAPSAVDAMILGSQYRIHTPTEISGLRVMLGEGSEVGGELYAHIIDSVKFVAGNSTSLISSSSHFISPTDLANGYIDVFFDGELPVEAGVYFAAVKLYSSGNTANVMVLDDLSLSQPEWASGIIFNGGVVQSKGNCFGIRMLVGSDWGSNVDEIDLSALTIYPNPSNDWVYVQNPTHEKLTVRLFDMHGRSVYETLIDQHGAFDFAEFQSGVYLLQIDNGQQQRIERLVLQ